MSSVSPMTKMQHAALRIAKKTGMHGRRIGLFQPRCAVLWSDALPGQYEDIFIRQDYAPPAKLPAQPRILDLGGFLGLASVYLMWRHPACRLVCVEPNPYSFAALRETVGGFARRCGASATMINKAVGLADGTATLTIDATDPVNVAASLAGRADTAGDRLTVAVDVIELRALLAGGVDFMKMDIEGMEYPLLESGAVNPDNVRSFAVELHDIECHRPQMRTIAERLLDAGYDAIDADGNAMTAATITALVGCRIIRFHAAR